ncbi:MAG: recombinase family protein [Paludibacteraceae bacterium]|nr:recombinase family protein [Paludibacteraceae bacterium]
MTAVIYARTSSSGSMENRQNTERQVHDLQEYAKYQKYDVLKVFEEHISGAKKNSERAILQEAIDYCITNKVDILLSSELSRIGRSSFEVLETVKKLIDNKVNLFLQKEQMTLLDKKGEPSVFAPILLSCLSFSYSVERESVQYRLNSGRRVFIEKGGKLGRKKGSIKSTEKKEQEYKEVLMYLRKGYGIRVTSKLTNVSESTVQRLKKEFAI